MEKHEIEKLQNKVKGKILSKIEKHLTAETIKIEMILALSKVYTRVDKSW